MHFHAFFAFVLVAFQMPNFLLYYELSSLKNWQKNLASADGLPNLLDSTGSLSAKYDSSFYITDYGSLAFRSDSLHEMPQNFTYFTWVYINDSTYGNTQTLMDFSAIQYPVITCKEYISILLQLYMNETDDYRFVEYNTTLRCNKYSWMLVVASAQVEGSSYNYSTFTISKFDATMLPYSRGGSFFSTWDESAPVRTFTINVNGIIIPQFPVTVKALYLGQYDSAYVSSFGVIGKVINHISINDEYLSLFLNKCTLYSQCGNSFCRGINSYDCGSCALKYCNSQLNGKKINCIATNILECDVCINSTHCSECVAPLAALMIDRTNDSTTPNGCFITAITNCTRYVIKDNKLECIGCAKGYYVTSLGVCLPCQRFCSACDGNETMDCTQCRVEYGISPNLVTDGMNCTCAVGYFTLEGECLPCLSGCDYCAAESEFMCVDTDLQFYRSYCNDDQFLNSTSDFPVCGDCHIFCDQCKGPANTNCVKCADDVYAITNDTANCTCKTNYTYSEYITGFCEYTPPSGSQWVGPSFAVLLLLLI